MKLLGFISCFLLGSVLPNYVKKEINKEVPTFNSQPQSNYHKDSLEEAEVATNKNETDLASMMFQLSSMLVKQEKAMAKYQEEIVNILEKQTEMLSLVLKRNPKKPKKSAKSSAGPSYNHTSTPVPSITVEVSPGWSYSGSSGPDSWLPSHPNCGGESQSPINLETVDVALREHKTSLTFSSYDQVNRDSCKLVNTGNTVTLSLTTPSSPHPTMSGGPFNTSSYHFSQAIFHWGSNDSLGSEHTIRTATYPMEMQFIHKTSSQGETKLTTASFLFEISQHDNPFLAPIIDTLGNIQVAGSEVDLNKAVTATTALAAASKDTEIDTENI